MKTYVWGVSIWTWRNPDIRWKRSLKVVWYDEIDRSRSAEENRGEKRRFWGNCIKKKKTKSINDTISSSRLGGLRWNWWIQFLWNGRRAKRVETEKRGRSAAARSRDRKPKRRNNGKREIGIFTVVPNSYNDNNNGFSSDIFH